MRSLVLIAALALAGCYCEPRFAPGEKVEHRLIGGAEYIVTKVSGIENYQGLCLVTVRSKDGRLMNLAVDELEPL